MTGPDPRLQPGTWVRLCSGEVGVVQPYQQGLANRAVPIRLTTRAIVVRSIAGIAAVGPDVAAQHAATRKRPR